MTMSTNLPVELTQLAAGLEKALQLSPVSGTPFIKLDKGGDWVFGSDGYEVRDGLWAINPKSFIWGYIAWGAGELLGEEMVSMGAPAIDPEDLPVHASAKRGWEKQVGLQMQALSGEFKGQQVIYKSSSKGGKAAILEMVAKVVPRIKGGDDDIVPVVALESTSYAHKEFGKINTPILAIDHWTSMDGGTADEVKDEPEPEAPTKRRRIAG